MSVQRQRVGVTADLTVLVPRDADGTLEEGAAAVLERIDGVAVQAVDVTDLTPRLNDLAIAATVDVDVDADPEVTETELRETLDGGFGVSVERISVEG